MGRYCPMTLADLAGHLSRAANRSLLSGIRRFSSVEMQRALERHGEGLIRVIPVIVRPADWQHTPLGELQALPKGAKPVVEWAVKDRAWLSVAEGVRRALIDALPPKLVIYSLQ